MNKIDGQMIGCSSYHFQFVMKDIISKVVCVYNDVQKLKVGLKTLMMQEKIRNLTDIREKLDTETQWTSKYGMVEILTRISDSISHLGEEDLHKFFSDALPAPKDNSLLAKLIKLNKAVLKTQMEC